MENALPYQNIITLEPGKRGGKPCIWGQRIEVAAAVSKFDTSLHRAKSFQP